MMVILRSFAVLIAIGAIGFSLSQTFAWQAALWFAVPISWVMLPGAVAFIKWDF